MFGALEDWNCDCLQYTMLQTMTLKGKLRIFAILPFAGVVLMTASFVSPGWVNFNVNFIEYRFLPIPPYEGPYEGYRSANSAHLTGGLWYYTVCVRDFIPNSDGFYDIFPKTGTRCHTGLNSYDFEERLYHGKFLYFLFKTFEGIIPGNICISLAVFFKVFIIYRFCVLI